MKKLLNHKMNSEGSGKPVHPSSHGRAFAVHSHILLFTHTLYLASEAEQASLSLLLAQTPKTGFFMPRLV